MMFSDMVFGTFFAPRPHMGRIARMDTNHPQVVGMCPGHPHKLISQNRVSKNYRPGPGPHRPLKLNSIILHETL